MEGQDAASLQARFQRAFGRRQSPNSISGRPPRAVAEALLLVLTLGTAAALQAQSREKPVGQSAGQATSGTYSLLYSFQNSPSDGCAPEAGLILDPSGNLYGTTPIGGQSNEGTVFKVTPGGTETVLHSFTISPSDGNSPQLGSLTLDAEGNLYGTTPYGGKSNAGTVYEVMTNGSERVLYSFTGGADGDQPLGGLVHDSAGDLYGTTFYGGSGGVVFKLTPDGTESVLHDFGSYGDGANPEGNLTRDPAGNLYGTTRYGGDATSGACQYGCGTVFEVASDGTETVLHSFEGHPVDGSAPTGGGVLRVETTGNIYGVTDAGGAGSVGTLFKLTPGGTETVLLNFNTGKRGGYPVGGLARDEAGNLYGTTASFGSGSGCGITGCGVLFELTAAGSYVVLHNFSLGSPSDGATSYSGAVRDASGNLYGTLQGGGAHDCGAVFKYTP